MCQRETRNYFHNLGENNNSNGQRGELQLWYQQVRIKTFQCNGETFSSPNCCRPDISCLDCPTDTNKMMDKNNTLGNVCPTAPAATNFISVSKNTNSTSHSDQQFKWAIFKRMIPILQTSPLFQSDPWPRCHHRSKTFWSSTGPESSEQGPAKPGRWELPAPSDKNNNNNHFYFPRMSSVKTVRIRPAQMMKEKIIEIIFPVLWILLKFFSPTKGKIR